MHTAWQRHWQTQYIGSEHDVPCYDRSVELCLRLWLCVKNFGAHLCVASGQQTADSTKTNKVHSYASIIAYSKPKSGRIRIVLETKLSIFGERLCRYCRCVRAQFRRTRIQSVGNWCWCMYANLKCKLEFGVRMWATECVQFLQSLTISLFSLGFSGFRLFFFWFFDSFVRFLMRLFASRRFFRHAVKSNYPLITF